MHKGLLPMEVSKILEVRAYEASMATATFGIKALSALLTRFPILKPPVHLPGD